MIRANKIFIMVLLGLILISAFSPSMAFATGTTTTTTEQKDIFGDDFNVDIGADGKMSVTSPGNQTAAWQKLLNRYKTFITGIAAIGAITMVVLFIFNFMKLGATATNSSERSKVIIGLLWTGIAAAGLGSVAVIVGIFYNAL